MDLKSMSDMSAFFWKGVQNLNPFYMLVLNLLFYFQPKLKKIN